MRIQEDIIPTLAHDRIVTKDNAYAGARVRRGPDWMWRNQDGGGEGTIKAISSSYGYTWAWVLWDNLYGNDYRIGHDKHDLIFAK
jgi:hypothetical protein